MMPRVNMGGIFQRNLHRITAPGFELPENIYLFTGEWGGEEERIDTYFQHIFCFYSLFFAKVTNCRFNPPLAGNLPETVRA